MTPQIVRSWSIYRKQVARTPEQAIPQGVWIACIIGCLVLTGFGN